MVFFGALLPRFIDPTAPQLSQFLALTISMALVAAKQITSGTENGKAESEV